MHVHVDRFISVLQDNRIDAPLHVFTDILHKNYACVLPQNLEKSLIEHESTVCIEFGA